MKTLSPFLSKCFVVCCALTFPLSSRSQILEYVIKGDRLPSETLDTTLTSPELQVSNSGGVGGEQFLSFHGLPSRHALVLWEGMPLSDPLSPGNSADVSTIGRPVRATLWAKPFASLYGSRASGGVLDLQWLNKESGRRGNRVSGGFEFGSEMSLSENLQVEGVDGQKGYSFSLRREDSRGISSADSRMGATEPDGYSKTELLGGGYIKLGAGEFTLLARHSQRETDFDGMDNVTFFPTDDATKRASSTHSVLGVKANVEVARDFFLSSRLSSGFSRYRALDVPPLDRFAAEHRLELLGEASGFAVGVEGASVAGEMEAALFAHDSIEINDADLSGGGRYEHAAGLGTVLVDSEVGLRVSRQARIFSSFGTIARRPTLFERLGPFGNSDLKPEVGFGTRTGVEFSSNSQTARIALFASRLSETVAFQGLRFENAGELAPRGLEVQSQWRVGSGTLTGTYQYLFKSAAEHRASLSLRGSNERRFTPEVSISAVSERQEPYLSTTPDTALKPYGLIGGGVTAKIGPVAKVALRVENLLNTAYQESYGYGTRGTTIWLGVQI